MDGQKVSYKSSQLAGADLPTFISTWLSDNELHFSQSTHRTYQQAASQFLGYWNRFKKPALNSLLIKQYVRDLKWRHCSAAYIQRQISVLRSFCAWAVDENLLPSNPSTKIPLPKISNEYRREALTQGEAQALLGSVPVKKLSNVRDLLLMTLTLQTGARLIELHRSNVDDYVRKGKVGILYIHGKGRETQDSFLVLVKNIADLIERYLEIRGPAPSGAPLFTSERPGHRGKRLSVRGIQAIMTSYLKKAGLKRKRVVAHSLRHSAATIALENGAHLMDVKDMMRHASLSTTQKYLHLTRRIEDGAEHYVQIRPKVEVPVLLEEKVRR